MTSISDRRAARGAEFMDTVRPGWFDEVMSEDLDIMSLDKCIWGQIYGDYRKGSAMTGLPSVGVVKYGFHCGVFSSVVRLTRAWRREIEKRRVQDFLMRARQEKSEQEVAIASA